jgi:hypothetical protein
MLSGPYLFERYFACGLFLAAVWYGMIVLPLWALQFGGVRVTPEMFAIYDVINQLMRFAWHNVAWIGFAYVISKLWDIESRLDEIARKG